MQNIMSSGGWQFFMDKRHRRSQLLRQLLFTWWGLVFMAALVASPFVFRNIAWVAADIIDMASISANNLRITGLNLRGTDKNGDPFQIRAKSALQKFGDKDVIHLEKPRADIARRRGTQVLRDKISADSGRFSNSAQKLLLIGSVRIRSSDGTSASANEMEINLRD